MGTRTIIKIHDGALPTKPLVCIYRQHDGYPGGLGQDIKDILGNPSIKSGYHFGDTVPTVFNGMGCLAAYLIGKLKNDDIGSVYLLDRDIEAHQCGAEFKYSLYIKQAPQKTPEQLHIKVEATNWSDENDITLLYDGPIIDFDPKANEEWW